VPLGSADVAAAIQAVEGRDEIDDPDGLAARRTDRTGWGLHGVRRGLGEESSLLLAVVIGRARKAKALRKQGPNQAAPGSGLYFPGLWPVGSAGEGTITNQTWAPRLADEPEDLAPWVLSITNIRGLAVRTQQWGRGHRIHAVRPRCRGKPRLYHARPWDVPKNI
jgi:hypothetical protein